MENLIELAAQVRAWADKQKAIVRLADEVEKLGQMDRHRAEHESALATVSAKIGEAEKRLAEVSAKAREVEAQTEALGRRTDEEGRAVMARANETAKKMVDAANERASVLVSQATESANGIMAKASGELAAAREHHKALQDAAAMAVAERETAQRELAALENKIEEARIRIRKLFEG